MQSRPVLEEFSPKGLYNKIPQVPLNPAVAKFYLEGLERRSCDYRALIDEFQHLDKVVFVFDPPYLNTDTKTYGSGEYRSIKEYLRIPLYLKDKRFLFFTSDKSATPELLDFLGQEFDYKVEYKTKTRVNSINSTGVYQDIMLYNLI